MDFRRKNGALDLTALAVVVVVLRETAIANVDFKNKARLQRSA